KSLSVKIGQSSAKKLKNQNRVYAIINESHKFFFWIQENNQEDDSNLINELNNILANKSSKPLIQDSDKEGANDDLDTLPDGHKEINAKNLSFANLFTRSKLLSLISCLDNEDKIELISMLPTSDIVNKDEASLVECLTSPACLDRVRQFESLQQQFATRTILKSFNFSDEASANFIAGNLKDFAKTVEEEEKSKKSD
ncbi:MAG: hypothetical protein MHPSP_001218, partial [Paramarteilia canceri]